jgi:hypothetical protein
MKIEISHFIWLGYKRLGMRKLKQIEELRKLNTKNLLRFYKAERRRFYGSGYWCDCGCGELHSGSMEQKYNEHLDYLTSVKTELNTREHIQK